MRILAFCLMPKHWHMVLWPKNAKDLSAFVGWLGNTHVRRAAPGGLGMRRHRVPDEMRGEVVKAFIVVREGFTPGETLKKEIQAHCKRVTAPYKYPHQIEFVDALPKTVNGKVRRGELRRREQLKPQVTR